MDVSHNYLVLSDLHLSEGRNPQTGSYSRNEDFFYDVEFAQLLVYHLGQFREARADSAYKRPWKLIINGDIFDFLQVVSLPPETHPLFAVHGVPLTANKKLYGLGTSEAETVWKLKRIEEGHPLFFQALGWFLGAHPQNELVLIKGNHDVELHWPKVQEALVFLVQERYATWYAQMAAHHPLDTPLPFWDDLLYPPTAEALGERVVFPRWFYYEEGLFFIEHGNQYDAANAFRNFLNPAVPDQPKIIELPTGSFFVRYFFNVVEQLHPFADNLRPMSRYINWALNYQFLETLQLITRNPLVVFKFWRNLRAKHSRQARLNAETEPLPEKQDKTTWVLAFERRQALGALRDEFQERGRVASRRALGATFLGAVLRGGVYVLLAFAVRAFALDSYWPMAAFLWCALGAKLFSIYLARQLHKIEGYVMLPAVGEGVRQILNEAVGKETAAVRLHIFGHDHYATIKELTEADGNSLPFRQWYVNTGCWLPSFSETDRLTRGDYQLTFLRLVPGKKGFDTAVPELLEWLPTANQPRPIRLLDERI